MKNWQYGKTHHDQFPHHIAFNRVRDSGVFEFQQLPPGEWGNCWKLSSSTVDWLNQNVGTGCWLFDSRVGFAVHFTSKAHAMLFKLTFSNGAE